MRMKLTKYVDVKSAHYLNKKYCYFFGSKQGPLIEFVILMANIYHPHLKPSIILATMDSKPEDTNYLERFWYIFNSAYIKK